MKRTVFFALFIILGLAAAATAGMLDVAKGGLPATSKDVELKLTDAGADLAPFAGGEFDPTKTNKYIYKSYGDAQWDAMAKSCAVTLMAVDCADLVVKSDKAGKDQLAAAGKALAPLAKDLPGLGVKVTTFVTSVSADPKKTLMLKDAKTVSDQIVTLTTKVPALLDSVTAKAAAAAGGAVK